MDDLFPESNKLRCKLTLLEQVIETEKCEVRRIGREMRDLISRKEDEILRDLDSIWEEVSFRVAKKKKETQKKIEEIEIKEREMIKLYENMEVLFKDVQHSLLPLTQIKEAVGSVRREMDIPVPYVKLTWMLGEVKETIDRMCRCDQQIREDTAPYQLKWSRCEKGQGETQLWTPCGIAISSMNDNIYVADNWKHRIQIFSGEGEWIRTLKDTQMIKPEHILFRIDSIFVQCDTRILKFSDSVDEVEKYKFYAFSLRGICMDRTSIYVGNYNGLKIISLTPDLVEVNQIVLHSEFCEPYRTKIGDVALSQEVFYVLLSRTEFPIQAFSNQGILLKCVIQKDCISKAHFFCLDQQQNVIVSDSGDTQVKVFSNEGKLLVQLSREQGQLAQLSGVVTNGAGYIFTVDWSQHDRLQAFSPPCSLLNIFKNPN